jgi:hypothetical protein
MRQHVVHWFRHTFRQITVICVLAFTAGVAEAEKIIIVSSYHPEYEWTRDCLAGIKSALDERHSIDVLYMDTKRQPKENHPAIASRIEAQLSSQAFDLLVLADDNALKYLSDYVLKHSKPTVLLGVNANPRVYFPDGRIPNHVYGVLERHLTIPLIRALVKFVPNKNGRYLVLYDDSASSKSAITTVFGDGRALFLNGVDIEWKSIAYIDEWKSLVREADQSYDAIVLISWHTLKSRKTQGVLDDRYVLEWGSANSQVPIFTVSDYAVGPELAVGAMVLTGYNHGHEAGMLSSKVLNDDVDHRFITTKRGELFFSRKKLDQYRLKLPAQLERLASFK